MPEDTVLAERHKICGKLYGNGDGMDFLACILIRSDQSFTELEKYFGKQNFHTAKLPKKEIQAEVYPVLDRKLDTGSIMNRDVLFDPSIDFSEEKYYAVVIFDGGYGAFLDIQGG